MEWFDKQSNVSVASSGQGSIILDTQLGNAEKKGAQVMRMILDYNLAADAVGSGGSIDFGVFFVEEDARAAGALPEADSEGDQPGWIWRKRFFCYTSDVNDRAQATHVSYDARPLRRYRGEDMSLLLVLDVGSLSGAANINIDGLARLLIAKA